MARRDMSLFERSCRVIGPICFIALLSYQQPVNAQNASSTPAKSSSKSSSSQSASQSKTQSSPASPNATRNQKTFSSPQEAAQALYSAAKKNDEDEMILILGPQANDIVVWTGDPKERKDDDDFFVKKYEQMHRLVKEPDDEVTVYVGAENWPLPIPLVQKGGVWYFDSGLGRREILYRRIGENELETVDVLRSLADAENEYFSQTADSTGVHEYARRFNSEGGYHDGLYWAGGSDDETSPVGPYVAQASYNRTDRKPLHGYYFKILTEQGPKAAGGARKYFVNGKMTAGFAFVAFPAQYRSSGVMTFIIGPNGVVYQKDLGPMTLQMAKGMTVFNPDATWTKVH